MQNQNLKIVTYAVILLLLGVGVYYYYVFLGQQSVNLDPGIIEQAAAPTLDTKLHTEVLTDKKFKELQKVEVAVETGVTSTPQAENLTPEEIAKVPRRFANPFKPF